MTAVRFSETMTGFAALGTSHPAEGYECGRRSQDPLALVLGITLDYDDLAGTPGHAQGTASGTVSFAPLGGELPVVRGTFELFAVDRSGRYRMDYHLLLDRRCGRAVTCMGSKLLHSGDLLHAWRQTTTLPVRLFDGDVPAEAAGGTPVLGAGIVRLTLSQFVRDLLSLRGAGDTRAQRVARVLQFVVLFSLDLGVIYALRPCAGRCRERGARAAVCGRPGSRSPCGRSPQR